MDRQKRRTLAKSILYSSLGMASLELADQGAFAKNPLLNIIQISDIHALRSYTGVSVNQAVFVLGYDTPGDGGGGFFFWQINDKTPENGLSVFGNSNGRWFRIFEDEQVISVKMAGAKGDGVHNDTAAINATLEFVNERGGGVVVLPKGTYSITQIQLGKNKSGFKNVTFRGSGVGASVLKQLRGRTGYGILMVDCVKCRIESLTIDSRNASIESGLYLFGCQDCVVEAVEGRNGDFTTFNISGGQFGFGTQPSLRNTMINCLASGQRTWGDGIGVAVFIASSGAIDTTFINCRVTGGKGDYFGSDFAVNTKFTACVANNADAQGSAGFWCEGGEGTYHGAVLENCVSIGMNGDVGTSELASALVIGCYFKNTKGSWSNWSRNGRLQLVGCTFENCCTINSQAGGVVFAESGLTATNCKFVNCQYSNVTVYGGPGSISTNDTVILKDCDFDRDIVIFTASGPGQIVLEGCTLRESSVINTALATGKVAVVRNCVSYNAIAYVGASIDLLKLEDNICRAIPGYTDPAITVPNGSSGLIVTGNTFYGYTGSTFVDKGKGYRSIGNNVYLGSTPIRVSTADSRVSQEK
ncbi:MAG: hypothetical protein H7Y37_13895 [Anaerolineae bacterium]|nr:hypothetical protein [Gloeobacterales cyanobacterium ES-bin-313]